MFLSFKFQLANVIPLISNHSSVKFKELSKQLNIQTQSLAIQSIVKSS